MVGGKGKIENVMLYIDGVRLENMVGDKLNVIDARQILLHHLIVCYIEI